MLGLFLGFSATAFCLTTKNGRWQSHYPWLILGAYTLISGAATAVARLGFGFTMAADVRYTVFTVMLYIAIVGLAFSIYETLGEGSYLKRAAKLIGLVTGLMVVFLWASTFTAERRVLKKFTEYRSHLQLVMRWADAIPENPELAWLSPYSDTPKIIHDLGAHDALRPRLVGKDLAHAIAEIPRTGNPAAGVLENAAPDGMGRLVVKGWARIPDQARPADCVVIGLLKDNRWEPLWVLGTAGTSGGFSCPLFAPNLPADGMSVLAWGIDLRNERAFPLVGEIKK